MARHLAAAAVTVGALLAPGAVADTVDTGRDPAPNTLAHAQRIRAGVEARYDVTPGRRLRVTEASSTGVVASLTLLSELLPEPRIVPAGNGVYFAICPARAHCPFPARSAAAAVQAFRPRRLAVELALRTFAETTADLVVVALPTRRPVFLVLERADLPAGGAVDAAGLLTGHPSARTPAISALVEATAAARLFRPAGLVPVSDTEETLLLARVTAA